MSTQLVEPGDHGTQPGGHLALVHRPLLAGAVLTATTRPGETWEKQGKRAGKLVFSESITEYRDEHGDLVVTARSVGVRTEKVVEGS